MLTDIDPEGAPRAGFNRYESVAYAINDKGTVVGHRIKQTGKSSNTYRAVIWKNGKQALLPTRAKDLRRSKDEALDINDHDVVVGTSEGPQRGAPGYTLRAVRWAEGQLTNLGTLDGDTSSVALAINNAGVIVGQSQGPLDQKATMWRDGQIIDLNTLLDDSERARWTLVLASGINDRGQIIGRAVKASAADDDTVRAFRLDPR